MSKAAYSITFYRDVRLGTHYFRPGEFVSKERLLQLCGSERVISRLERTNAIRLVPLTADMELSEGHEMSSPGGAVLEPPSQEPPGGAQHTEEHGEASNGDAAGGEAGQDPSADASPGAEGEAGSEVQAEGLLSFDPQHHTVDEVKAFVTEHPGTADYVLSMELDGRKRKGLLDWLAAPGE